MSCFDLAPPPLAWPASHAPSSLLALAMASCIIVFAPERAQAQSQREGKAGFSEVFQVFQEHGRKCLVESHAENGRPLQGWSERDVRGPGWK